MTVYVDNMEAPLGRMVMCHMVADTPEELLSMAKRLGLRPEWFQDKPGHPHYDISKGKRRLAVKYGAVPVTMRELAKMDNLERERPVQSPCLF